MARGGGRRSGEGRGAGPRDEGSRGVRGEGKAYHFTFFVLVLF